MGDKNSVQIDWEDIGVSSLSDGCHLLQSVISFNLRGLNHNSCANEESLLSKSKRGPSLNLRGLNHNSCANEESHLSKSKCFFLRGGDRHPVRILTRNYSSP